MLQQQKNHTDQSFHHLHLATTLNIIQNQTDNLKQFIHHLRGRHSQKHSQLQSENSDIFPKSDKVILQPEIPMDTTVKRFNSIKQQPKHSNTKDQDHGIKFKPRTSINGRDEVRGKINQHNITTTNIKPKHQQAIQQQSSIDKVFNLPNLPSPIIKTFHPIQPQITARIQPNIPTKDLRTTRGKSQPIRQTIKHNKIFTFQKESLNATNLCNIVPEKVIIDFLPYHSTPTPTSSPSEIYTYFSSLCACFKIDNFTQPLIKRYRNCVYYGEKVPTIKSQCYQGFVWYYKGGIYYGNFQNGRKQGQGIQISLEDGKQIWKGHFITGAKTGYFQYLTPTLKYDGMMKNGYFHGNGKLQTQKSKYIGDFQGGMKHGKGQQNFGNGKAIYRGQYSQNCFEGNGQLQSQHYYYKGHFRKSLAHGYGYEKTTQCQYSGQFKNGKKDGRGIIKTNDGTVFDGYFQDGKAIKHQPPNHYSKGFRITQSHNKHKSKNQIMEQLTEQNDEQLQDNRVYKKRKNHEFERFMKQFPEDASENEQDPIEPK